MRIVAVLVSCLAGAASAEVTSVPVACDATGVTGCLLAADIAGALPISVQTPAIVDGQVRLVVSEARGGAAALLTLSLEDGAVTDVTRLAPEPEAISWAAFARDGAALALGDPAGGTFYAATYGRDGTLMAEAGGIFAEAIGLHALDNGLTFDADGTLRLVSSDLPTPLILAPDGTAEEPEGLTDHVVFLEAGYSETWVQPGMIARTTYTADGAPSRVEIQRDGEVPLRLAEEADLLGAVEHAHPVLSPDGALLAVQRLVTADPAATSIDLFDTTKPGVIWNAVTGPDPIYGWTEDGKLVLILTSGTPGASRLVVAAPSPTP